MDLRLIHYFAIDGSGTTGKQGTERFQIKGLETELHTGENE